MEVKVPLFSKLQVSVLEIVDVWEQYTYHNDVSQSRAVPCAEVYIIALAHNEIKNYKHTVSGMYVYAVCVRCGKPKYTVRK